MIYVYGLCYWILDYAKKSVDSILKNASEPICLIVIEGRSKNSPQFLDWGKQALKENKIQKFIAADDNCKGSGMRWAIDNFPPDPSEDFVVLTDLDLVFMEDFDWIKATKEAMLSGASSSGFQLSPDNYIVPPNGGWNVNEASYGGWLLALKTKTFETYPRNKDLQDYLMIGHARQYGPQKQIKHRLYHLGWDSWKDDPEYFKEKNEHFNWQSALGKQINYTTYSKEG